MKKMVLSAAAILLAASSFASADVVVNDTLVFGDGTRQSTATLQGPVGLQGARGDTGPVGPAGPQGPKGDNSTVTLASICAAITAGGVALPFFCPLTDPTTGMVFQQVYGGTYVMGDTFGGGNNNELPTHQVTLSNFYMGKYEVTQGEWQAVMGSNPSYFKACGTSCPVEQVSWNDIQTFITTLNQLSGKNYRLPTEAEWEYAARSGGKSQMYSGGSDVDAVAWQMFNSGDTIHAVGQKQANGLGLFDMSGNVRELVNDWYGAYSSTAQANPIGPTTGSERVVRGGSWLQGPLQARTSSRDYTSPDNTVDDVGFRLVAPTP